MSGKTHVSEKPARLRLVWLVFVLLLEFVCLKLGARCKTSECLLLLREVLTSQIENHLGIRDILE